MMNTLPVRRGTTRKLAAPALAAVAATFMLASPAQALTQYAGDVESWAQNPINQPDEQMRRFYAAVRPESSPSTVAAEVSTTFSRGQSTSHEPSLAELIGACIAIAGCLLVFGGAFRRINQLRQPDATPR